ncbi:MAG: bifunctional metallophosphatase/5'-nucleotidase [Clostridia bacterium]|nr:bifunctional metallophosphatase/5'-nucleotidase [Clostridia bacterium]
MKKIVSIALSLLILLALTGCDVSPSQGGNSTPTDVQTFQVELDSKNAPTSENDFSFEINELSFQYENAYNVENSHVALDKAGFITNETPFGDLKSVTINYSFIDPEDKTVQNQYGFGYLKYRTSANFIDNANDYGTLITTVDSDYTINLSANKEDNFISFWSPRKVEINKISFTYSNEKYQKTNKDFTIQVISTNDVHGQIKQSDKYPGLSSLTAKMQSIASSGDKYNIFIDQGDIYQGTAEAGLANGYNMDDFLLINGYESTTLGNHEFDWGEQRVIEHVNYSSVTILANNIRYIDGSTPEWATPYKLVSRNGVKIGIIGALGNVQSSIAASKFQGMKILTGSELTEQIIQDSQTLKDMGADFIILSLHDGAENTPKNNVVTLPYYDISSLSRTYVNLVLEGHTHRGYSFYDYKDTWHIQNSSNGASFSVSQLTCKYQNGDYVVSMDNLAKPVYYNNTQSVAAGTNSTYNQIDNWYETYVYGSKQSEIVGKNVPYMDDSVFEALTAKVLYEFGLEMAKTSGYTPIIGGGFIRTRTPYNLKSGTITYGDVYNLLPFENDLVLCSILGADLISRFINADSEDYYIYPQISASEIVDTKTYYIMTDSYTSDYSYNNLTVIENYTITYKTLYSRDIVAEYLKTTYLK